MLFYGLAGIRAGARHGFGLRRAAVAVCLVATTVGCGSSPSTAHGITLGGVDAGGTVVNDRGPGNFVVTSDAGGSNSPVVATALAFVPPATTITVDGVTPQTTTFQLQATVNGQIESVSPTSLAFDRPDLGSATIGSPVSVTASGVYGGTGTLHGIFGGLEATATLTILVAERDLGTTSTSVAASLDAAGTTLSDPLVSTILYPYDKTVFPLGLT